MKSRLLEAHSAVKAAADRIEFDGRDGWSSAAQILAGAGLPACKKIDGVENFELLREQTWHVVNKRIKALAAGFLRDYGFWQNDLAKLSRPFDTLLALTIDFSTAYAAAKRSENRLDFADLERFTRPESAQRPITAPAVADLRARYHYVLVDEFQDINPLQESLLERLRCPLRFNQAGNLFVVGDVKQSIYGFRLAEPQLFLDREKRLRELPESKAFITLPHNFRSRPALLHAMNGIFERLLTPEVAGIHYADGHALQPGKTDADIAGSAIPIEVRLVAMNNTDDEAIPGEDHEEAGDKSAPQHEILGPYDHEARMVADRIAALLAENRTIKDREGNSRRLSYRDIAILLRTMKGRAGVFARALAGRGIPVHADLSAGFFDAPEIKDALALLRTLDNPQQDIPLATTLLGPFGHFSNDDLARIRLAFDRKEVPFAIAAAHYAAAANTPDAADLPPRANKAPPLSSDLAARLHAFFERLARWRELLRTRSLHEALAAIFDESKVTLYLAGLEAPTQRSANLQLLCHKALSFASFRKQGLHRFLRFIERLSDDDAGGEAPVLSEASDVVRIMSVHKSKGLEFPVVFVSGLGGKNPSARSGMIQLHRDLGVGLASVDVPANVYFPSALSERITDAARRANCAEELRLFYVALTRAREQLILTGHMNKTEKIADCRFEWQDHAGPLPEDHLLRATTPLDWLLPALAAGSSKDSAGTPLRISWNAPVPDPKSDIAVILHASVSTNDPAADQENDLKNITDLLSNPPTSTNEIPQATARQLARINANYPHSALTRQPAVQTVTFLKAQTPQLAEPEEAPPVLAETLTQAESPGPPAERDARREAARLRGIATHRILELLDFANCDTRSAVDAQIDAFLRSGKLETAQADTARSRATSRRKFLTTSAAGKRLRNAARRIAAGDRSLTILRELPFTMDPPRSARPGRCAHRPRRDRSAPNRPPAQFSPHRRNFRLQNRFRLHLAPERRLLSPPDALLSSSCQ